MDGDDGGPADDGGPRPDVPDVGARADVEVGADAGDRDAGCAVDGDGDGACRAHDCDDADGARSPLFAETCTPIDAPRRGVDEDCDQRVDEGCPLSISSMHEVSDVVAAMGSQLSPRLSADGLALYTCARRRMGMGLVPYVSVRRSVTERFGPPEPLPMMGGGSTRSLSMSPDGLEMFLEYAAMGDEYAIHRTRRADVTQPFPPPTLVSEIDDLGRREAEPSLTSDRRWIVWTRTDMRRSQAAIFVAHRDEVDEPFGTPMAVLDPIPTNLAYMVSPVISDGALEIFAIAGDSDSSTHSIIRLTRMSIAAPFAYVETLPGLVELEHIFFSHPTQELFYASRAEFAAVASTATERAPLGIFRARMCRSTSCPEIESPCLAGERSDPQHRYHCYEASAMARTFDASEQACVSDGMHLATAASEDELDQIHAVADDALGDVPTFMGGRFASTGPSWITGEPFVFSRWAPGEPNATVRDGGVDDSVSLDGDDLATIPGSYAAASICERWLWPLW